MIGHVEASARTINKQKALGEEDKEEGKEEGKKEGKKEGKEERKEEQ